MHLRRTRIALTVALLALSSHLFALPNGPSVAAGTATFTTSGGTLTIANSNNAIINWQGFSIGAGETTRFNQPSASSTVLNRVVTSSPSSIFGSLTSNGNVFLVNPNGIVFASGSQISVGGMTVSTSDITDTNFLAGNYVFAPFGSAIIELGGSFAPLPVLYGNGIFMLTGNIGTNLSSVPMAPGSNGGNFNISIPTPVPPRPFLTATSGTPIPSSGSPAGLPSFGSAPGTISRVPAAVNANLTITGLVGTAMVTSTTLNLEKREVAF